MMVWARQRHVLHGTLLTLASHCLQALHEFCQTEEIRFSRSGLSTGNFAGLTLQRRQTAALILSSPTCMNTGDSDIIHKVHDYAADPWL
jgi:hypothetical protein